MPGIEKAIKRFSALNEMGTRRFLRLFFHPACSRTAGCLISFLFLSFPGFSQRAELDSVLRSIDYKKDSVKAIFDWVIGTLDYDTSQLMLMNGSSRYGSNTQNIVREAVNRKKGVCLHYAELFNALLTRAGYESYVIQGYTRQGTSDDKYGHAWNAVKTKGIWLMYDPTWSAGYVNGYVFTRGFDYQWFRVPPARFIQTHIPFDPIWQLLNPPLSHEQIRGNGKWEKVRENYNFQDSIRNSVKASEQERLLASLRRIKTMGIPNSLTQQYVRGLEVYTKNSSDYMTLQNSHRMLNMAIASYNEYILLRNRLTIRLRARIESFKTLSEQTRIYTDSSARLMESVSATDFHNAQYKATLKKQISDFSKTAKAENLY